MTKVLVIGGGPGGYAAAIRAAQFGLETTLVESGRLGGTCLIRGCIPSKALIHAADQFEAMMRSFGSGEFGIKLAAPPMVELAATMRWKDDIVDRLSTGMAERLEKAKVRVLRGWAQFSDAKTCIVETGDEPVTVIAEHVILAAGSRPATISDLPLGGKVISSTEALSLEQLPKTLAVVGAGYIGLELGIAFRKLGTAVSVVEVQDRILPHYDAQLTAPVRHWLDEAGIVVHLGVQSLKASEVGLDLRMGDGRAVSVNADRILLATGRRPATEGWGLESMAVDMEGSYVAVDQQLRTSMRNVWAIGDLVGEPMLAHKAMMQGEMVAEIIAGTPRRFDPAAIPSVCFTEPEIVAVGLTVDQAEAAGLEVIAAIVPFAANGRALTLSSGRPPGFVRIVADRHGHRIRGIQAVGRHVAELASGFVSALEMGAVLEDVAGTIHAHPTLGETYYETAIRMLGDETAPRARGPAIHV
jgi:dihydrolipoamide dehydrogenase